MVVNAVGSAATPAIVEKDKIGFAGLSSETFLKLLIAQLQNQDPTSPVGNEEILQQLSAMRSLQASVELTETLKTMSANQQVASGATFLGKIVIGLNDQKQEVSGIADRVFVRDGRLMIGMGADEIAVSSVTGVALG
jgi:flagellar basal-body rod modification protein FlgD